MGTALQRLETGGLVTSAADGFGLDASVFTRVARTAAPPQKTEDYGYADEQTESVVRTFVRDGRLPRQPAQRSRLLAVRWRLPSPAGWMLVGQQHDDQHSPGEG